MIVLTTGKAGLSIIGFDATSSSQIPLPLNQYTGVVLVNIDDAPCSGSLLTGGFHILTAAHCLVESGNKVPPKTVITVTFKLPQEEVTIPVKRYIIHPKWTGYSSEVGNDLAVLRLQKPAPTAAQQYEIYRSFDEVGKIFTKVGYGYIGTGAKGQDENSNSDSKRYAGQNKYDALVDVFKDITDKSDFSELVLGSQLCFDFDDGTAIHDAFGRHFPNLADRGLGKKEIASGSGDSGSPNFIDGKIAGVTSWGYSDRELFSDHIADIDDNSYNGSFGEFAGDVRVSHYARFIDNAMRRLGESEP